MSSGLKGYSKPWGDGKPVWVRDDTPNNSDKSFTVPAGKVWDLRYIHPELVATATVGNRVLWITITDGTSPLYVSLKLPVVAAGQQGVFNHYFGGSVFATTASQSPLLSGSSPTVGYTVSPSKMILHPGYVLRIYDSAAIDPAADDLTVVLHYEEYDA